MSILWKHFQSMAPASISCWIVVSEPSKAFLCLPPNNYQVYTAIRYHLHGNMDQFSMRHPCQVFWNSDPKLVTLTYWLQPVKKDGEEEYIYIYICKWDVDYIGGLKNSKTWPGRSEGGISLEMKENNDGCQVVIIYRS